jgi:SAM-dependent methyltransferase
MIIDFLKRRLAPEWRIGMRRSDDWAGAIVASLKPATVLDVGCGDGSKLLRYLDYTPKLLCGVEASPSHKIEAEKRGFQVSSFDLNGRWPFPDNSFDVVHCAYLIEHLHNTRLFVMETFRVLKPGGTAVMTSENLCSWLNLGAMLLGYTPFTLINCCGWYLGNPLGLYANESHPEFIPIDHPAFAGVVGHVRALSVPQAKDLFEKVGFRSEVSSLGLLPLFGWVGKLFERWCYRRGHFLMIKAIKPA